MTIYGAGRSFSFSEILFRIILYGRSQPDTCRSLTLEHRLVAWPSRGITGQDLPFPHD